MGVKADALGEGHRNFVNESSRIGDYNSDM